MAEVRRLTAEQQAHLAPYLPHSRHSLRSQDAKNGTDRPFVTLTYASSLDSMISLAPSTRTTLSGPETKSMTHYLRMHHDAILVGVGTAIPDDPGLNSRYPGASINHQPRPLILDPKLRWDLADSKVVDIARQGAGKQPWVIHAAKKEDAPADEPGYRRLGVESSHPQGRLAWEKVLHRLWQEGIRSVMIEGGATVISALLQTPQLVDSVIITIAPTWLGQGGVLVSPPAAHDESGHRTNAANLSDPSWLQFGQDVVLCGGMRSSAAAAG